MDVMNTLKILERLKIVTNSTNYAELARALNIKDSTIRTWKTRGTIPYEACAIVTLNYNTNLEWLLKGDSTSSNHVNETQPSYNITSIPFYKIQAGNLVKNTKYQKAVTFHADFINNEIGAEPDNLFLMFNHGDGMYPTLKDGATLIVEKNITTLTDGIFVIRQNSVILVKRLHNIPTNKIRILSDNTVYEPYEVDKKAFESNNIEILGRVIWSGQKI